MFLFNGEADSYLPACLGNIWLGWVNFKLQARDAPKWKFLAKAEQNETLGRIPNMVFRIFSPMKAYFATFFAIA